MERRTFIDFKAINERKQEEKEWEEFSTRSSKCPHFYWLENKEEKVKYAKCRLTPTNSCRMHLCPLKKEK